MKRMFFVPTFQLQEVKRIIDWVPVSNIHLWVAAGAIKPYMPSKFTGGRRQYSIENLIEIAICAECCSFGQSAGWCRTQKEKIHDCAIGKKDKFTIHGDYSELIVDVGSIRNEINQRIVRLAHTSRLTEEREDGK